MKNIAIGILLVIMASILIEPLVEIMEIGREKIILGTTMSNASRAAVLNLEYEQLRDLDAKLDKEAFIDEFSEIFAEALNLSQQSRSGDTLVFSSVDGKYNDLTVKVDVDNKLDDENGTQQNVALVKVHTETKYKFRTKYLKALSDSSVDYDLECDRMVLFSVKN